MRKYIFLTIFTITSLIASNQDVGGAGISNLSNTIRLNDASEDSVKSAIEALKSEIFPKKELNETEEKVAYALALGSSSIVFDKSASEQLQAIQKMATPEKLLADDFIFIRSQIQGFSVVMEKVTEATKKFWTIAPTFLEKDDKEKKTDYSDKEWDYKMDKRGANSSFYQRMSKVSGIMEYDIWVSYLTQEDPTIIFDKRFDGINENDSKTFLNVRNVAMIMSIQANPHADPETGRKTECYSPMGILRTDAEDVRLEKLKKIGGMQTKPYIEISVLFHALTCKMVKSMYPEVKYFWTQPLPRMKSILTIALQPDIIFSMDMRGHKQITGITQKVINKKFQTPWSPSKTTDPSYSLDFCSATPVTISVENLLNVLFPYTKP